LEQRSTAYQEIRSRLDEQEQQLADAKSDLIEARTLAASVTEPAGVIAAMEAAEVPQLLADRETLNEHVSGLDAEWDRLKTAKAQLADECRDTKRELLEAAPVIACTLSSLTTKPELANRRFDMVIIDEAASAKIPQLVYAGSKADRSLAYVGDFLQNEPIVDVADAITEEQRQLKPWMGEILGSWASVIVPPPQRTLAASSFESNIAAPRPSPTSSTISVMTDSWKVPATPQRKTEPSSRSSIPPTTVARPCRNSARRG
jgi:hypothetical protein